MSSRDVTNYRVARYSNFDPNGSPAAGTLSELATTGNQYYNDNAFGGLPMGWYAYGVKALYTSGLYSRLYDLQYRGPFDGLPGDGECHLIHRAGTDQC